MMDVMRRFEWDMHNRIEESGRIPSLWHDIAKERPERTKVQVNIGLDEDVLKFFKSLGKGYGAKINLILKSFMHARLAGVLEGAETVNHFKTWELRYDEPKPEFGFFAREVGAEWEDAPGEETRAAVKEKRSTIIRRAQAQRDAGG
jgi:BrnA antitoxin of type II toxin-antitoxin system